MLITTLIAYISNLFSKVESSHGSELESYIVSKNPQTTYDVEYWTREYDKHNFSRSSLEKIL